MVEQVAVLGAGEAFFHVHRLAAAGEAGLVAEVARVDDESVAVPVADAVAEPPVHVVGAVLVVDADDPGVMDHLRHDDDVVLGLDDPRVVVVQAGQQRRSADEAEQATLGQSQGLGPVERSGAVMVEPGRRAVVVVDERREVRCHPAHGRGRHLGPPTVLRLVDDRGAELAVHHDRLGARVDPERVVAADTAAAEAVVAVAALDRRGPLGAAALALFLDFPPERFPLLFHRLRLLGRQVQVLAVLGRTIDGGYRAGVVDA